MTQNKARDVKLVAAGDGSVGKTCLLMTYAYNKFSEGYVPTVFDTYDMELLVEGQSISRKFLIMRLQRKIRKLHSMPMNKHMCVLKFWKPVNYAANALIPRKV